MKHRPAIDDLAPFFDDPCWMWVVLAREAPVAVIFRRGPSKWWRITRWDTRRDFFDHGQWFHGRMYPDRCGLSPDGNLLVYFAGKFRQRDQASGYGYTWTAVSRPPYLTALALWPIGDTWGGGGVFVENQTLQIIAPVLQHHPNHPPGRLRVSIINDAGVKFYRAPNSLRKSCGDFTLVCSPRTPEYDEMEPSRRRKTFTIERANEGIIASFEAHWAGWDQRGRLIATVGGRVLVATPIPRKLKWRELASMKDETPQAMESPAWAKGW